MLGSYKKLNIETLINQLSQKGPFHSERRVIFEFAKILEEKGFNIFLEYPNQGQYEDIRVETPFGVFIFEFKYCPQKLLVKHGTLEHMTRSRSPMRKRLSDLNSDIERTKKSVKSEKIAGGCCIFITNQKNIIHSLEKQQYKILPFNTMQAFVVCV